MRLSVLAYLGFGGFVSAAPVINEIMFHPPGIPEDPAQEWIELHNPDASPFDLSGCQLTKGVTFTVPEGTSIAPGGYVVVAADVAAFQAAHPGFSGTVVGGWTGRLSNKGEQIQLDDAQGDKICDVTYADEGDWALRARSALSFGHRGWEWINDADGGGRSLELRNPALSLESGQNWGPSETAGGTPGAANTLNSTNLAPLIRRPAHKPEIPAANQPVVVSCELQDEAATAAATLHWRLDGGTWQTVPMTDSDGDGDVEASIPGQANLAIVEWYISATDGVHTRTWPAPARTSNPGVSPATFGQVTNALFQVDNSFNAAATFRTPADSPIYRLIMTDAEADELNEIQTTSGEEDSEATFNGTFISHDGAGVKVRYLCGFRNRGQASALGPPFNYHVSFSSSDLWNDRSSFGINCQYVYSQALGQALFQRAGLPTQEAAIVRVRTNGADLAESGTRQYGRYVRVEGRGGDWAENHYPDDPDGNFYRLDDHAYSQGDARSGEFRWEGTDPAAYSDTFLKETNKEVNDYSDLINFARIVSAPSTGGTAEQPAISDAAYPAAVAAVLDLDNFYRFIATDALIGNQEGGLQSGRADDTSIYRGVIDPRFRFIPHDLDDVFDIGNGAGDPVTRSIFSYDINGGGVQGLTRLFNHPELVPKYYAALLDALNTWYNRSTIDPIVDQIMAGWVPATDGSASSPNRGINEIKAFVDARRANVLGQIQQNYSLTVTGNAADTPEGYKVTTTGAATFAGTFNVARTYSITVNGQLAQTFYRTAGPDPAGTWKLNVPIGGGGVLSAGLNRVVIRFWDAPAGAGNILREFTADVFYNSGGTGTLVSGTLSSPGSLTLLAPDSYVPGVPILVRVDLKDANGDLNRAAWNSTITLTGSNDVTLTPNTVTLFNGVGSALVSISSSAGGGGGPEPMVFFTFGTGGTGSTSATSGTPGSTWKGLVNLTNATIGSVPASWKDEGFDDSSWVSLPTQTGYGDGDENRAFAIVDYDAGTSGTQRAPSYLFRNTFTIENLGEIASVTGQIKYDDAYSIYINGTRVQNSANLPVGTPLTSYATDDSPSDNTVEDFTVPLGLLKPGVNTIAVEIHQDDNSSSDVTFDLAMQANLPNPNVVPYLTYGSGGTGSQTNTTGTPGSEWRALTNLTVSTIGNVPASWKNEGFDDSTWSVLPSQTGYGDGDENRAFPRVDYDPNTSGTQSAPSYLFRNTFTVTDVSALASLTGQVKFDDSCAVYVNGVQVYRHQDLSPNAPLTEYTEVNDGDAEENLTADFVVPPAIVHNGVNTIAVEVHQVDPGSSDVTFDLRLQGNLGAQNPGDFVLSASTGGLSANKGITSLFGAPETVVSGNLPAGVTNWSGVVRVTGDVTVPSGATLNVAPGTHVLMAGTAAPGSTTGADIIVTPGGTLAINGTAAQPVNITCSDANARWGQIYLNGANSTVCNFALISRGGHAPGQGHTGRGPMWRLNGANLTFDDSAMGDGPAKALYSQGTCDFTMRRSLMARMVTGPETGDGTAILIEDSNIQEILPHYRESNSATPDDEDCLYVHNGPGRPVAVRRSVFALCGDDVFDCLGGPILVEDTILRDGWDKGMSLLNNDLVIRRTLIVDCDKAIVPKSGSAATRTITVDRCTIISENHDTTTAPWGYSIPPSSPDPDSPSTGLYTQNKSGQSDPGATLAITATNSIILAEDPILVDAPYNPVNTVVTYSITRDTDAPATAAWPGLGNLNGNPLFVSAAADNYHLAAGSPAINAGDPTATDPDGSRADMGAFPTGVVGGGGNEPGEVNWTLAGSPYHVTASTIVPANLTLRIHPGVNVYFAKGARLTVNGRLLAEGSPERRIVFSHVPGTIDSGDCDPIKNGVQTGPPKWGGVRIFDSMAQENVVRYCDFINAQGTSPSGSENYGSIGFIRSWGWVDHCTWAGTHLRMCYGRNSKMTVTYNVFPDMFLFDPVLNRIENPTDFLASADNNQEPLKVEYPTTDPEVAGNPAFPNGLPANGHWRVYFNEFNGNRGHNDVFDADSGRWGQPGQFLMDCRYNHFRGLSGDEHIDLGGDAYIASNIFQAATKDQWTSDTGYSNAISSGDKGAGTTIFVARNLFFDLDHAINCKLNTATIFEHNTVANLHADYLYPQFSQDVKCAPVNFFIPEDGTDPSYGDGAYLGFNLISNVPRLFSGADARKVNNVVVNDVTTKIEFFHNLLDQIGSTDIGANHPGGIFNSAYGVNTAGAPDFVNQAANDFELAPYSAARNGAPGGLDYGWTIPEWAYIAGGPVGSTADTTAQFTVGGPGIVAYKWRLDGGDWSAPIQIGAGGVLPRTGATVRQDTIALNGLTPGAHTLEVLGQDAAGNWQDADPARNYDGLPQAGPTVRTWTVNTAAPLVRINEILANGSTAADRVELYNAGATAVPLFGWSLTDDPTFPNKFPLNVTSIDPGGYIAVSGATLNLDKDGDSLYLFQGPLLRDSVTFGAQPADMTIGVVESDGVLAWKLGTPSFTQPNNVVRLDGMNGIRLSEWFASGAARYDGDWIELSNSSAFPVDLSGLRITDNRAGAPSVYVIPPLSFIGANGFLKLVADGDDAPGHLPFSLDAEQETLSLLAPDGSLLDTVAFYPQTTDYSMGRDGSGSGFSFYELPTGGIANGTTDANALALIRGLRITEIMFNAIGGPDYDFVELTNVGDVPLDLEGVEFVTGISFTFGEHTLAPGASIVVAKNEARFRKRYGDAVTVAGQFGGQLDNAGEPLALQLPPPFDANILTFEYDDAWFPAADGSGPSIVIRTPATTSAGEWSDRETWNAGVLGGNPGGITARTDTFSGWMTLNHALTAAQDDDRDGIPALVEFGLGMNPASALDLDGPLGLPVASIDESGRLRLSFDVPEIASSAGGHGFADGVLRVEASDDLASWSTIAMKTSTAPWTGSVSVGAPAGGYVPVVVTDSNGTTGTVRFLRVRVEWVP